MKNFDLFECLIAITLIGFIIFLLEGIELSKKQMEINKEIEIMKIEKGIYNRNEVNLKIESSEGE